MPKTDIPDLQTIYLQISDDETVADSGTTWCQHRINEGDLKYDLNKWYPIDLAPKDGTRILIYDAKYKLIVVAAWMNWSTFRKDSKNWCIADAYDDNMGDWVIIDNPRIWRFLPALPDGPVFEKGEEVYLQTEGRFGVITRFLKDGTVWVRIPGDEHYKPRTEKVHTLTLEKVKTNENT